MSEARGERCRVLIYLWHAALGKWARVNLVRVRIDEQKAPQQLRL